MPHFAITVTGVGTAAGQRAIELLPTRFPEIELVDRRPGDDGRELWTCAAPGRAHIEHWCRAAALSSAVITEREPGDT